MNVLAMHEIILQCRGRLVITGMGKSGHIGRKMAATFASTGTPSFFMHPGEAGHGDLGMLVPGDVLIAISNSGKSDEIMMLMPLIKRLEIPLITISGDNKGPYATKCRRGFNLGQYSGSLSTRSGTDIQYNRNLGFR